MTMRMLRVLDSERAAREEVERLALDQAALRRVATLVAKAAPREDIYAAVAAEIAQRLGADVVAVLRYEANGTATIIGGWGVPGLQIPIGTRLSVAGEGVAVSVWHTRRPARVERFDGPPGSVAASLSEPRRSHRQWGVPSSSTTICGASHSPRLRDGARYRQEARRASRSSPNSWQRPSRMPRRASRFDASRTSRRRCDAWRRWWREARPRMRSWVRWRVRPGPCSIPTSAPYCGWNPTA